MRKNAENKHSIAENNLNTVETKTESFECFSLFIERKNAV